MDNQDKLFLRSIALQLERWAVESREGGWSTHQVTPMQEKAEEVYAYIGRCSCAVEEV